MNDEAGSVWLIWHGEYENAAVIHVFATEKLAEEYVAARRHPTQFDIEEREVRRELPEGIWE